MTSIQQDNPHFAHFHIVGYEQDLYEFLDEVKQEIIIGGLYDPETGEEAEYVECFSPDCTPSDNQL